MNGERLRRLRRQAGLTQTALGQKVGLAQSMIGALERGTREATLATARALAQALAVPVGHLIDVVPYVPDHREAVLEDPMTPPGLRALAQDIALIKTLALTTAEWRALCSIPLEKPASKAGYLALLSTIRLISEESEFADQGKNNT